MSGDKKSALLVVRDLRKTWGNGKRAVSLASLEVAAGSTTVMTGDNGAGKTTVLRMLAGLVEPDPGASITWRGEKVAGLRPGVDVSYLHQQPYLLRRSVAANAAYPLKGRGAARENAVAGILRWAGLEDMASRPATTLSGGEGRRLAMARVWATGVPLVLLDEPTANLDAAGVGAVEDLIAEMAGAGRAVVVALHEGSLADRLASARRVRLGG